MIFDSINFLLWLLGIYLMLNCLYLAFFALMALLPLKNRFRSAEKPAKKTAVLFPTYRENVVILESVKVALQHNYKGHFEVVVIADGLEPTTLDRISQMGGRYIEVVFERSTKGKALRWAMNVLKDEGFEMAVVLDVDNLMGDDCLNAMSLALQNGYKVVQAHRTAKNMDSNFAFLDACNEEVNNQIYRKGPAILGLSASLIGSGIGFDFVYFKYLLDKIGDTVGEDKQLDFLLAQDREAVAYLNNTYVFDEKIENAKVFTQQRSRWLASQIEFMKKYALQGFVQLFKGNLSFFNKSLQTLLMPRMLLLGSLFILLMQSLVHPYGPTSLFWLLLFLMLCTTLLLAIPARFYANKRFYIAIFQIPRAMLGMFMALLKVGNAKKTFIVTPHKQKDLD